MVFGDRSWTLYGSWQNFICNVSIIIFFRQLKQLPEEDYQSIIKTWGVA